MKQLSRSIPMQVRFGMKVQRHENGCWLWNGSKTKRGYGEMYVDGQKHFAHRISWRIHRGPIPDGFFVCHHCDTPGCVNPEHLFLGTQSENISDAVRKGRVIPPCFQVSSQA